MSRGDEKKGMARVEYLSSFIPSLTPFPPPSLTVSHDSSTLPNHLLPRSHQASPSTRVGRGSLHGGGRGRDLFGRESHEAGGGGGGLEERVIFRFNV